MSDEPIPNILHCMSQIHIVCGNVARLTKAYILASQLLSKLQEPLFFSTSTSWAFNHVLATITNSKDIKPSKYVIQLCQNNGELHQFQI